MTAILSRSARRFIEKGSDLSVLHLPLNIAGDPVATVAGEVALGARARLLTIDGTDAPSIPHLDLTLADRSLFARQMSRIARTFTEIRASDLVVFDFNSGAVDYPRLGLHLLDLRWASMARNRVCAVVFHGSDVRPLDPAWTETYTRLGADPRRVAERLRIAERCADLLYVKTPDLLHLVPGAAWLPQAVVVEQRDRGSGPTRTSALKVAHAPTRRALKGTESVLESCEALMGTGIPIELDLIEDVPHDEALRRFAAADVVVDQLRAGWYGVVTVEAMWLGTPVICNIDPRLAERAGVHPPVLNADADSLISVLSAAALNRTQLDVLSEEGREYAQRLHAPTAVAARLLNDAMVILEERG